MDLYRYNILLYIRLLCIAVIQGSVYHDGHKPWRPQNMSMTATAMTRDVNVS